MLRHCRLYVCSLFSSNLWRSSLFRDAMVTGLMNISFSSSLKSDDMDEKSDYSIHGAHIKEVHEVPFNMLIRPFPSQLEEEKVLSLMETLKV